jgi:tripartite-type tricarboxylate transporter receptor subunit TctC
MANQIESFIDPITTNVQLMKDGVLRALAVSTPQRLPTFPDVPTFAELGFPKLTSAQWLGLSGPKNLPAPIVQRLSALIPQLVARPDLMTRFEELQTLPRNPPPMGTDFTALINQQIGEWTAVARQFNIVVT